MKLEKIFLNQITPANYNPREISNKELQRLTSNLEKFGLVDPIIINLKNNKIIGGHQRYRAIEELYGNVELDLIRLGTIGWVFFDKDLQIKNEEYEKALNLSLNKISGEWDRNKLGDLINDLEEDEFDMDLTGFTPTELSVFDDDSEIEFNPEIFMFDEQPVIQSLIECPKCKHSFRSKSMK